MARDAKRRGAKVAYDAVEKMSDDVLPRLTEVLSAAAGTAVAVEAKKRGQATVAAAKGELALPPEKKKKKGRWVKRLAIVAAVSGAAVVIFRKFFGSKDADWQAARPSTPYAPPPRPEAAAPDAAASAGATAATADAAACRGHRGIRRVDSGR